MTDQQTDVTHQMQPEPHDLEWYDSGWEPDEDYWEAAKATKRSSSLRE